MKEGIFICKTIPGVKNKTHYQRLKLLSDKFDMTVFSFGDLPSDFQDDCDHIQFNDSLLSKLFFPLLAGYHTKNSEDIEPDFIHTSHHSPSLLTGILFKFFDYTWIADIWDDPSLGIQLKKYKMGKRNLNIISFLSYIYSIISIFIVKRFLTHADLCIFVPDIYKEYGFSDNDDNLLSITNGVDIESTISMDPVYRDKPTIFYVGSVQRARGAREIIQATQQLSQDIDTEFTVEFVGPVPDAEKDWLASEVEKRDLDSIIDIIGPLEHNEVLNRMANVDVCLCILSPDIRNYRNTYPIKLFEYMAMGKAIICTRLPGTNNIIEHNKNGILIPPKDSLKLCDEIKRIMNSNSVSEELGEMAKESSKGYSWEKINTVIVDAFDNL